MADTANDNYPHWDVPDNEIEETIMAAARVARAAEGRRILEQFRSLMNGDVVEL
jgi:hypothetical protein